MDLQPPVNLAKNISSFVSNNSQQSCNQVKILNENSKIFFLWLSYPKVKDPALAEVWEVLSIAWGDATAEDSAAALASANADNPVLAIEDGDVDGDGGLGSSEGLSNEEPETSSVTTTVPEQTPDEPMGEEALIHDAYDVETDILSLPGMPQPDENGLIGGWPIEEFRTWALENPKSALQNMDGAQSDPPSPKIDVVGATLAASPGDPGAASSSSGLMGPPQPPSPGKVKRKAELHARMAELRRACNSNSKMLFFKNVGVYCCG